MFIDDRKPFFVSVMTKVGLTSIYSLYNFTWLHSVTKKKRLNKLPYIVISL